MKREKRTTILAAGLSLCLSGGLMAAEKEGAIPQAEAPMPSSSWRLRGFAFGDSSLKQGEASYAISSVALELEHCHWRLGLERQYFAWRHAEAFVEDTAGRDPWEFFNRVQLGYTHQYTHSEDWMSEVFAGGMLGFERDVSDSFTGYLGGYGIYRIRPRLLMMMGVFYARHQEIETDFDWMPILGVAWNPEETRGFSAQVGLPETQARWHFDEHTRLVLDFNTLEGGVTRLASDSPVRERGYVELVSASVTLRFEKRLRDGLEIATGIGHSLHREMKLYDSDGDNRRSVDIERAPSIEVSIRKPF